ncbi:aminoacyl-tRNA deacylase [Actinomadura parmotrematis]|uniref:YbaK/aminoacyl-tRNA synthetase-associated domain-containing protein n=1 Tax=Actinomadura parmotrematis TaxID=2864039 RepID=A0ABS7G2V4_9ACTN|nr:YbaK/EbsC family protein [Actinomadura parmotrematis]MBW8487057.1 hypothetical protein [Actinomadura parmotrematis]
MKDALTIHRALLERETRHEIVRLPIPVAHADGLPRALGLPAGRCLVTRVYACTGAHRAQRFLAGAVVPAGERPRGDLLRAATGARLVRPAPADLVNAATEYAAGFVCPLLLPAGMPLFIDRAAAVAADVVYTATGEASTALGIGALDLLALSGAEPAELLAPRRRRAAPAPRHPVG